jgi:hypothetical protein
MAFARLFPIDAVNAQDDDRTSSELNLSDGTSCGSPHGANDCGDLPRSPRSSSALTASSPREKDPPQPIAPQGRGGPAYHPDRQSNVSDASSGRTALPIFQSVSSDRDKHALCDFCNAAEFFSDSHSAGLILSFDVTNLLQQAGVSS